MKKKRVDIVIVHGEKPTKSRKIPPTFIERLKVAERITKNNKSAWLIITGGKTRKNAYAETIMGKKYLTKRIKNKILTESNLKTTIENIKNTKKLVEKQRIELNKIIVITSKKKNFQNKMPL